MIWRYLASVLWLIPMYIQVDAPLRASFSASNPNPLVGEPVDLTLTAELLPGATIVSWPDLSSVGPAVEVRTVGTVEIAEAGGRTKYRQNITIVFWEPGTFRSPEMVIQYQADGRIAEFVPEHADFSVISVLDENDLKLRPLKPVISIPYVPPAWIIGGVGVATSAAIWWISWRRRVSGSQADIRQLDRRTLAALRAIDRKKQKPDEVYAAVADCLRDYVTEQFQIAAHEMTTAELVAQMQSQLSAPLTNRLYQLMGQADLVKFAGYEPEQEIAHQYLEAAARWVQMSTKELNQHHGRTGA